MDTETRDIPEAAGGGLMERLAAMAGPECRDGDPGRQTVPTRPPAVRPQADGYRRRSPVQVIYRAADHYRRLWKKCAAAALGTAAVAAALALLCRLLAG